MRFLKHQSADYFNEPIEIIAPGFSLKYYRKRADETWCICGAAEFMECDIAFFMGDIEDDWLASTKGNYKPLFKQLEAAKTAVITSREIPDLKNTYQLPLQKIVLWAETMGAPNPYWYENTICYAIAYAGYLQKSEIHFHGVDYANRGEQSIEEIRCTIHWLSFLAGLGVKIRINPASFLCNRNKFLSTEGVVYYGYRQQPKILRREDAWPWTVKEQSEPV